MIPVYTFLSIQKLWANLLMGIDAQYEDVNSITLNLRREMFWVTFQLSTKEREASFYLSDAAAKEAERLFPGAEEVTLGTGVTADATFVNKEEEAFHCSFLNTSNNGKEASASLPGFVTVRMGESMRNLLDLPEERKVLVRGLKSVRGAHESTDIAKFGDGSVVLFTYAHGRLVVVVTLDGSCSPVGYVVRQGVTGVSLETVAGAVSALKSRNAGELRNGVSRTFDTIGDDDFVYASGVFPGRGRALTARELEDRADTKDNSLLAAARRIGAANQLKAYRLFLGR